MLFFTGFLAFGQGSTSLHTKNKKAIKQYQEANYHIKLRQFAEALNKLGDAVERDPDFLEAHLRMAFCYEVLREFRLQQVHLEEVVRISPKNPRYKNVYYSLGRGYFDQGKYEKAREMLQILYELGISNDFVRQEALKLEENIRFAIQHIQKPLNIKPVPLPPVVNTFPQQYFPVLTADENVLIFTRRTGTSFHDDEDIYISEKDAFGEWQNPVSISPNINSQFNEGTCTISADGRILIFTTCEGRESFGSCDLYMSQRLGSDWSVPENLGKEINSKAWESQPSLSADGRVLYFISDRKNGMGKRDIYVSERLEDGSWSQAVNAGPGVNTIDDEVSPFIHVNGKTLFFSSRGYPGFGGFDIYFTERIGSSWTTPENIGYPINDHDDQVSLFITTNGENAYYSYEVQGQEGKKSLLYTFRFPDNENIVKGSNYLTGIVRDKKTDQPLKAEVELFDLDSNALINVFVSDPVSGRYLSILSEGGKYGLYVQKEGYLFESRTFNYTEGSLAEPLVQDFYLQPITVGAKTVLNNIFFEFDSYELKDESITELEKVLRFLELNPEISIEIEGHTDDVGSEAYNLELSSRRAESVYSFLLSRDISADRLVFKGYGESEPLMPNDSDANRALNRRIEFKVLN
jgi:outer membrane protein OmpA-like peptidoglycan-associated protein/tetratricopeptide (TPR) repeat protein